MRPHERMLMTRKRCVWIRNIKINILRQTSWILWLTTPPRWTPTRKINRRTSTDAWMPGDSNPQKIHDCFPAHFSSSAAKTGQGSHHCNRSLNASVGPKTLGKQCKRFRCLRTTVVRLTCRLQHFDWRLIEVCSPLRRNRRFYPDYFRSRRTVN